MNGRAALAFSMLLVACSGGASTNPPGGGTGSSSGGSSSGGSGSGGSSSGGSSSGGSPGSCPSTAPATGGSCSPLGLWCEYGGDPDVACNTVSVCDTGSVWTTTAPAASAQCPTSQPGAGQCPATYGAVPVGKACTASGAECAYPQGRCSCTTQVSGPPRIGGGATWICEAPGTGCPEPRPQGGSACSPAGLKCDYGSCTLPGGTTMECTSGTWGVTLTACAN